MTWAPTSPAAIEALARAALAAAYPRAIDATRAPRPTPEGRLPAYGVTVETSNADPASMSAGLAEAEGDLAVEIFVRLYNDADRLDLGKLAQDVRAVLMGHGPLSAALGDFEPAPEAIETGAEAANFARLEIRFAISWLEAPAPSAGIPAHYGLI